MKTFSSYYGKSTDTPAYSKGDIGRVLNNLLADNLDWGIEMVNDAIRYLVWKYYFNERNYNPTLGTIAQTQFYNLPPQTEKIINVTETIGSVLWQMKECPTRAYWDYLNTIQFYQDFPSWFFIYNNQVGFWPNPATTGNLITINYKTRIVDLVQADYTTGTISSPYTSTFTGSLASGATSATLSGSFSFPTGSYQVTFSNSQTLVVSFTNGSTAVTWTTALTSTATSTFTLRTSQGGDIITGSGTTFAPWMANNWFRVPYAQTNGDQQWYQLDTYYDTTHIALKNAYTGGALSGVTYTIGQGSILPETYQDLPLYRMGYIYYTTRFPDAQKAELYKKLWDEGEAELNEQFGSKTSGVVLNEVSGFMENPNLFNQGTITQSNP